MPVMTIRLVEGQHSDADLERLLVEASRVYADGLECPIERVRVFVEMLPARRVAVGGVPSPAAPAPFFDFVVLAGRPLEQRQRLLADLTGVLVDVLGAAQARVRGLCREVAPENWAIGGEPASAKRADEIAARARQAGQ